MGCGSVYKKTPDWLATHTRKRKLKIQIKMHGKCSYNAAVINDKLQNYVYTYIHTYIIYLIYTYIFIYTFIYIILYIYGMSHPFLPIRWGCSICPSICSPKKIFRLHSMHFHCCSMIHQLHICSCTYILYIIYIQLYITIFCYY